MSIVENLIWSVTKIMDEKKYTMEDILRALEVSGIQATHVRKKFFNALIPNNEKMSYDDQLEKCLSEGF